MHVCLFKSIELYFSLFFVVWNLRRFSDQKWWTVVYVYVYCYIFSTYLCLVVLPITLLHKKRRDEVWGGPKESLFSWIQFILRIQWTLLSNYNNHINYNEYHVRMTTLTNSSSLQSMRYVDEDTPFWNPVATRHIFIFFLLPSSL